MPKIEQISPEAHKKLQELKKKLEAKEKVKNGS
jgi:hypothetical protein